MSQYVRYPNSSSILKVATLSALPATASNGDLALTLDTDVLYVFNTGSMTWVPIAGGGGPITVSDTNSIDLTLAASNLSAALRISSNAADANNLVVPLDVESTGVVGLRAQVPYAGIRGLFSGTSPILYNSSTGAVSIQVATAGQDGYLSSTDWSTFNSKQAAGSYITALTGDVAATGPGSVTATIQPLSVTAAKIANLTITNAQVSGSAAITYAKLSLANSIVNADINSSAAIVYSKLSLSNSILNADINTSAAIAYSKLNLSASIQNSDVAVAASISMSKLQALTANRAVATDGTGHINTTAVTDTEQGYLSGVTSAIQTQLNGKQATGNYITALTGDVTAAGPGSVAATIAPLTSEVFVDTGNGYGSTATFVRRFSNIRKNTGSDITYADSATNGGTFTIVTAGVYTINYTDYNSGGATFFAPTVDVSSTSTSASALSYANGRRLGTNTSGAGTVFAVSWTGILAAGQVVRAMTDGNANASDGFCAFSIVKVSR